jgi:hypothetical protein
VEVLPYLETKKRHLFKTDGENRGIRIHEPPIYEDRSLVYEWIANEVGFIENPADDEVKSAGKLDEKLFM